MGIYLRAFLSVLIFASLGARGAETKDLDEKAMIERIKDRCADFYKMKRQAEQRNVDRRKGASELHKVREAHEKELDKARAEYVKNRKARVHEDPRLEKEWEMQDRAWREQNKIAGQRYSRKQREVKDIQQRGCHLSEKEEYDLNDVEE